MKTHLIFINVILILEIVLLLETMWENIVEMDRPEMKIWRMCSACCITMATNRHSDYVILTTFPRQQWLHERAPILCYKHTACLVLQKLEYSCE
jgi:hypothetical protein